jgi:dTMP kinase
MTLQRGRFITVEGQDGAGKTTNLELVHGLLREAGKEVVRSREPGGTELGEQVREWVLHAPALDPDAELLLIFAARAQHLTQVIRPALEAGRWVLCDRFTDATYAYQGAARALGHDKIAVLEQMVQGGLRPDLTLLLDVDVTVGHSRSGARSAPDRFEVEDLAFKQAVRAAYLDLAREHAARFRVVDAGRDLAAVQRDIQSIITDFVARHQ